MKGQGMRLNGVCSSGCVGLAQVKEDLVMTFKNGVGFRAYLIFIALVFHFSGFSFFNFTSVPFAFFSIKPRTLPTKKLAASASIILG